jgi:AraC family transcriptional regulator of arabinose operon
MHKFNSEIQITECSKEACASVKVVEGTHEGVHKLHLILRGKGTLFIGGKEYVLSAGEIFCIPPDTRYRYAADSKKPWTYAYLCFQGSNAEYYYAAMGFSVQTPVHTVKNPQTLVGYFNEIAGRTDEFDFDDMRILGTALLIFSEITYERSNPETHSITKKHKYVNEAVKYMLYNHNYRFKIRDVADSLGITVDYLTEIFFETTGVTPRQYLIDFRIRKAAALLESEEHKDFLVRDIALICGYYDQLYFCREFKRHKGLSPSAYRQKNNAFLKR